MNMSSITRPPAVTASATEATPTARASLRLFRSGSLAAGAPALFLVFAVIFLTAAPADAQQAVPAALTSPAAVTSPTAVASPAAANLSASHSPRVVPGIHWQRVYPHQFKALMQSPVREVREGGLVSMIALLQQPGYDQALRTEASAKVLVPALLKVYARADHPRERKMAATAICFLGQERNGIETLVALSENDTDRKVQRHAQRAIGGYYGRTYPELVHGPRDAQGKLKSITLAEIDRAKRHQKRVERRQERAQLRQARAETQKQRTP